MQKGSYDAERIVQRCWRGYEDEFNAERTVQRCWREDTRTSARQNGGIMTTMLERGHGGYCKTEGRKKD